MGNDQLLLCGTHAGRPGDPPAVPDAAAAPATGRHRPGALIEEVDGLCAFDTLSIQLQIHANDTRERKSLSHGFDMPPQLTVMLLLEGEVRVSINQTHCLMSARKGPVGYLWLMTRPGVLVRHIQAGQRVRKVNVTVPLEGAGSIRLPRELSEHISLDDPRAGVARWSPSPQALRCAQEILTQNGRRDSSLHSLQAYISGLSLLQQALRIGHEGCRPPTPVAQRQPAVKDRDAVRARKIRDCILLSEEHHSATPQALAQKLGMSVSTLQRLFKAAYGTSVMEFQRTERLNAARAQLLEGGLTVGEAGYRAGYSTVSNFSSAFHRTFGYPPSACVRR
ncbi:AraC family transcriptional regulator [Hydrogenophaga sp.]|uniref:AraC family transcriptional regulator n=1 Tax=Hydrogenophaga sp. TaxID=1904254 RepID=UPI0026261B11|nr:AraC family transcriptional regulator [Hydrogenophaga sp.]MCW5655495.1 helix-turn-helix transcriptional regulator [Hydrogenophaga sp.]